MSPALTSQSMAASSKPCEPGQPRDHVSSHSDKGFPRADQDTIFVRAKTRVTARCS